MRESHAPSLHLQLPLQSEVCQSYSFPFPVYWLAEETESTNRLMAQLLETGSNLSHGSTLVAPYQTAGKGQGVNQWHSSPHANLLFSTLLTSLPLSCSEIWSLSELIAITLYQTLNEFLPPSHQWAVKWPNDIILNHKKVAGILIANQLEQNQISHSIVGIGLNVNETSFPSHLPLATSMAIETKQQYSLPAVLQKFLSLLHAGYPRLSSATERERLHTEYNQLLYLRGESALFQNKRTQTVFRGTISHVSADGRLHVVEQSGQTSSSFALQEIALL